MAAIELTSLVKRYGKVPAVRGIDLSIADGEFVVFVGPSGCGKSTTLRMIAGLEDISGGAVTIAGKVVNDLDPKHRNIAMVFQNYAIYPHLTVGQNIGFGLYTSKLAKAEKQVRIIAAAKTLGLEDLLDRRPSELSGGQRQRVAIGRAMVRDPVAFLFDEPLSNLDAQLRAQMRIEIKRLHQRLRTTTVYVTHDQVEAMTLGDRVAVLRDGVIQQCDVPQRLFENPSNLFVGAFIGSPAMNLVEATVVRSAVSFGDTTLNLPDAESLGERRVALGIRPTSFVVADAGCDPSWPRMTARVDVIEALGAEFNLLFTVEAPKVATEDVKAAIGGESGADEGRLLADDRRARFTARIYERIALEPGGSIELAIDPSQLYMFDLENGARLSFGRDLERVA